jgi:sterol desaturase/sphingolipid hydroxylase (fatty acid hydroxylase superfamily)
MMDPQQLLKVQTGVAVGVLVVLWLLETGLPLFVDRPHRYRHAWRNLVVAGMNLGVIGALFAGAVAGVAAWAERSHFGLLHQFAAPFWVEVSLALLLFDAWMYLWHRANHSVPFLWRFHRMHHSDPQMDVTTGLRFHFGEIVVSSALRLAVIPLLGLQLWQVILYETILLPVIAFHHSNVAMPERYDRLLRAVIVSPNMHRVHHSDWQPETDSNFSSIFSWWDRFGRTLRLREDVRTLRYGLRQFQGEEWESLWGLLKTPLAAVRPATRRERVWARVEALLSRSKGVPSRKSERN